MMLPDVYLKSIKEVNYAMIRCSDYSLKNICMMIDHGHDASSGSVQSEAERLHNSWHMTTLPDHQARRTPYRTDVQVTAAARCDAWVRLFGGKSRAHYMVH